MSSLDDWYQTELHTADLIRAVVGSLDLQSMQPEDLWNLLRLTWIGRSESHWQRIKIPALCSLFRTPFRVRKDLDSTIQEMTLPASVKVAATQRTGFSNFYNVYRNSSLGWCGKNQRELRKILISASELDITDRDRVELAGVISKLDGVPSPSGDKSLTPNNLVTPLVATIDPLSRFPIINGREGIKEMLTAFGADKSELREQVAALLEVIGQFGIEDAFRLDTSPLNTILAISRRLETIDPVSISAPPDRHPSLRDYDESERKAVLASRTVMYRKRHNRMTRALRRAFTSLEITQGAQPECRYDALIHNYNGEKRDLLIEAKPDLDKGSFRLAIGQLLDYKRYLPKQKSTDLALLSICSPDRQQLALLKEIGINAAWFVDETCTSMSGTGNAWTLLKPRYSVPES